MGREGHAPRLSSIVFIFIRFLAKIVPSNRLAPLLGNPRSAKYTGKWPFFLSIIVAVSTGNKPNPQIQPTTRASVA